MNVTADTSEFLNIVEAYAEQLPEEKSKGIQKPGGRFLHGAGKSGEPVVYKELSYYLDEAEPARFESFVREHQETPRDELIPDKNQLRKYVRFSGRSKDLSIQFAAELLGRRWNSMRRMKPC